MGQATGFMEFGRIRNLYRDTEERLNDYREVVLPVPEEDLLREGARCMDCGIPFCHSLGCPLNNLIPEWNDMIYRGKWYEAWQRLELTNNFPEITGRLCPALCEASCTLSINRNPVSIKQIELAVIERAFKEGWVVPLIPERETGKRVAVVGSGPSGLAAAQILRRLGHRVSVFEKSEKIGGILRYGIPDFKLEKEVLDRRLKQMEAEGVEFETDVVIGEDLSARYLRRKFDAVLLALGAGKPRDIDVPGKEGRGKNGKVLFALEYLKHSNLYVSGDRRKDEITYAEGKNVLVIGGGDTGSDCVGTALRQGADFITQVEILPKPVIWNNPHNPGWPSWPKIFRASTSHEEGESKGKLKREWSVLLKDIRRPEHGRGLDARFIRIKWENSATSAGKPAGASGKGGGPPFSEIKGSDFVIKTDLILLAMGFVHVEHSRLLKDLNAAFDARGNIKINPRYGTSETGVFAAGDAHSGASLVVRAIDHGRKAAFSIDSFLQS
ncbi:MAG: glutamate synthase subunit beta [Spirochaetes bacterium]|nr:glutamate synthase subunit beta [Spirochaetota bacterium]